jgi:hypothetical protein
MGQLYNGSSLNVVKYITTFAFIKYISMQDSYSELIKLLLPEIIVEYFELTLYKRRNPPPLLKRG